MAGSALKRLMAEHRQLMKNPPEGIVAGPKSDDNYFEWEANILGPPDTCFEYGLVFCMVDSEYNMRFIQCFQSKSNIPKRLSNVTPQNEVYIRHLSPKCLRRW